MVETTAGEGAEHREPVTAAAPTSHPEVHVGLDGWLFLTGGGNRVLEQYGRPGLSRKILWQWRRIIGERVRRVRGLGGRYLHAVAPEKLTVYHDAVDGLAFEPERAPALRLARWLRLSGGARALVDLVTPLRAARWDAPLYRRTDSHWTYQGGEIAYRTILRRFGVAPREDIAARRVRETVHYRGDLGGKFEPTLDEAAEGCRFETQARRVHANALIRHYEALGRPWEAHIGAHAVFRNDDPAADPRRLVVFGDSYCQHTCVSPVATLTPFLADTFREVHFLWSTSVDWSYLGEVRPDFVLGEVAERFMIEVPPRGIRIGPLADLAMARKGIVSGQ